MPTFLFDAHVFGPIKSRRLGSSFGINLLSTEQKVCNFNCIYCECGITHRLTKEPSVFVDKGFLIETLQKRLIECISNGTPIDTITFAGNGEPTLHPKFLSIVKSIVALRNEYFPEAQIAVLTNGYTIDKKRVARGLSLVDKAIIKLDAGDDRMLTLIDRPKGYLPINRLLQNIEQFEGNLIIQTMFLKGSVKGKPFDNSTGKDLENWFGLIKRLEPSEVMLYSLDRDTPLQTLEKISKETLTHIAKDIRDIGIKTVVV